MIFMKNLIWILVFVLIAAHQDSWNWNDNTLVFGFMPMGLFYQAGISLAAGVVWFLASVFAWPPELTAAEIETADAEIASKGGSR